MKTYVFIDPFSSLFSGVSTYSNTCVSLMQNPVLIIKRDLDEDIENFRIRVGFEINNMDNIIIEVPETLYTSKYIIKKDGLTLHVRLHLSQSIGKDIQGLKYDKKEIELEQIEISRADIISSPSKLLYKLSSRYFKFNEVCFYPNPVMMPENLTIKEKKYDLIFIGRWQELKGIDIVKKLIQETKYSICVLTPERLNIKGRKGVVFDIGSEQNKRFYLQESKCLILPSLFEAVGMVGLEALSYGVPVVASENTGIHEYSNNVFSFKRDDFKDLYKKINFILDNSIKSNSVFIIKGNSYFNQAINNIYSFKNAFNLMSLERLSDELIINKKSSFSRKWNKFKKNPVKFIKDMNFLKKGIL